MSKGKEAANTLDLLIERTLEISIEQRSKHPTLKGKDLETLIYDSLASAVTELQGKKDLKFDPAILSKEITAMHLKIIDEFVDLRLQPSKLTPEQWEKLFQENVKHIGSKYVKLARQLILAKEHADYLIKVMGGENETKKNLTELPEFIFKIMEALQPKPSREESIILLKELCQRVNLPLKLPDTLTEAHNALMNYRNDLARNTQHNVIVDHAPAQTKQPWISGVSIEKRVKQFLDSVNLKPDEIFSSQYHVGLMLLHLKQIEPNDMIRLNMLKQIGQQFNIDLQFFKTLAEAEQRVIIHALRQECQHLSNDHARLSQTGSYTALPELNQRVNDFGGRVRRLSRESVLSNHSLTASLLSEARQLEENTYDLISKASKSNESPARESTASKQKTWAMANSPSTINKNRPAEKTAIHRQHKGISTDPSNRPTDH